MDLTYEEYTEYINHLFLQQFVDFDYKDNKPAPDTLTILGDIDDSVCYYYV